MDIDSIEINNVVLTIGKKYTLLIPDIKEYIHVILVGIEDDERESILFFNFKNRIKEDFDGDLIIDKIGKHYTINDFVVEFQKDFIYIKEYKENKENKEIVDIDIDYIMKNLSI